TVDWVESGGPEIRAPERQGFGTQIMKATIERQLRGTLRQEWHASGLRCTFSFASGNGHVAESRPREISVQTSRAAKGTQVLLVEDEALVGMMIADFLGEIGFRVLGPFTKTVDGLNAAKGGKIAAAVLDVNVGGEEIYPLAEYLKGRGIPFVFVTGYGADSIDERFAGVPVLQKPVDRDTLRQALLAKPENVTPEPPAYRT